MIEETVTSDLEGKRTPSALTKQLYRVRGFLIDDCERTITRGKFKPPLKSDLFGFADHVAVATHHAFGVVNHFVQSTSASNHSARVKKVAANEAAKMLNGGSVVRVVSWKRKKIRRKLKSGKTGKSFRYVYEGRISTFEAGDFTC